MYTVQRIDCLLRKKPVFKQFTFKLHLSKLIEIICIESDGWWENGLLLVRSEKWGKDDLNIITKKEDLSNIVKEQNFPTPTKLHFAKSK